MALQTWSRESNPKIGRNSLKSKHTFIVMFLEGQATNKFNLVLKEGIRQLLSSCFELLGLDEKESIEAYLNLGNAFVICAFPNPVGTKAAKLEFIETILFSADKNGIWVDWLAITNKNFSTEAYGKGATNVLF